MSLVPFVARDTEEVIAVVEIWRQNYNERTEKTEYVPIMKIQPYYKWWISEEGLKSYEEATNWYQKTKKVASKIDISSSLLTGTKTLSGGVKGLLLDTSNKAAIDVLGVQVDTTSKFGNRTEIAFADQEGLIYRTLRTNDIIFIWLIDMKDTNWVASLGGAVGTPMLDKAMIALYYEKSSDFKLDWKKDWKKSDLLQIRNDPLSMLQKGKIGKVLEASNKLKGKDINRPKFPNFAGFLTVKRRHVARSGQFRAMCQDPIRYFQHYKFNFGEENVSYLNTPFNNLVLDPLFRDYYNNARGLNLVKMSNVGYMSGILPRERYKIEYLKIDIMEFFNAMFDLSIASSTGQKMTYFNTEDWKKNRTALYQIIVDKFIKNKILDCPKGDTNDKWIYIKYFLDPTTSQVISAKFAEDEKWDKKVGSNIVDDYFVSNMATRNMVEAMETIHGQINTSGIMVQRDPSDIHTSLDGGVPSIFDIFETFLHRLAVEQYQTKYNVRRALWSKSYSYISKSAFVSLFHYRFCGRDLETLEVVSSQDDMDTSLRARFNFHKNDIDEYDIWEVNTQTTSNEGKFDGSNYSAKISFPYKSSSNNSTKIINLGEGEMQPIRTFKTNAVTAGTSIVNDGSATGYDELEKEIEAVKTHLETLESTERGKVFKMDKTEIVFSKPNEIFGEIVGDVDRDKIIGEFNTNSGLLSLKRKTTVKDFIDFAESFMDEVNNITRTIAQYYKGWVNGDTSLVTDVLAEEIIKFMNVKWETYPDRIIKTAYNLFSDISFFTGETLDLRDFIKKIAKYTYTSFRSDWLQRDDINNSYRTILTKGMVWLKRSFVQYVVLIIRTGLYSILKFIYGLTSFSGKNGSLYMSAKPLVDIGDEIILWREGGDGIVRQTLDRKYYDSKVGTVYKTASRLTKAVLGQTTIDSLFRGGAEGKVFYEDYLDKSGGDFVWYVWKHVIYVGNFGVTSGFTSKIYITDEPLNFGTQFLDDSIMTRQFANMLFETGLGGQYPQEIRRILGV